MKDKFGWVGRWFVIAACLGVGAMAAVGASEAGTPTTTAAFPVVKGCKAPAKWKRRGSVEGRKDVTYASTYEDSCDTCWDGGWKAIARDFGLRGRGPVAVALSYAEGYRRAFRQVVFDGCLRGFELRGKP